jgi:hypothetical protein
MTRDRLDGLTTLIVGCLLFAGIGIAMAYCTPLGMTDFAELYYGSLTVIQHHDPYQPADVEAVYRASTGSLPEGSGVSHIERLIVFVDSNLPTTLMLIAPLAALPWKFAVSLWTLLLAGCFILACFQVWSFGAGPAPRLYGGLLFLILVNSGLLLCAGNTAGLVVGLSVITVSSFLRDRFVAAGILCLAVALAMKPHDAGPIWLFFVLMGGVQRRRALKASAWTAVMLIAAVLWISHAAPHWLPEYQSNLHAVMSPGGRDFAGASTQGGRGIGQIISLQAALSPVFSNPRIATAAAWILCLPIIALWWVRTLRFRSSPESAWLGLAVIAAIAMLPFYHRTYDARLLVLAIPACAFLWNEHRARGRWALALTIAVIVLTGDIFWIALFGITRYSGPIVALGMIPAPLALLALGVFYLCVYLRRPHGAHSQ